MSNGYWLMTNMLAKSNSSHARQARRVHFSYLSYYPVCVCSEGHAQSAKAKVSLVFIGGCQGGKQHCPKGRLVGNILPTSKYYPSVDERSQRY